MVRADVRMYCKDIEKVENYELAVNDKNEMWDCHHRLEQVFTREELVRANWYYDRKPQELIFMKHSEHGLNYDIHIELRRKMTTQGFKGKKHTDEVKLRIAESNRGKHNHSGANNPNFGKRHKQTEETCLKKSLANKGKVWWSNGIESRFCFECPGPDYHRGRK